MGSACGVGVRDAAAGLSGIGCGDLPREGGAEGGGAFVAIGLAAG